MLTLNNLDYLLWTAELRCRAVQRQAPRTVSTEELAEIGALIAEHKEDLKSTRVGRAVLARLRQIEAEAHTAFEQGGLRARRSMRTLPDAR